MTTTGAQHFKKGSAFPPLAPGVQRIYSMRFCPFAQRTRMALIYKNIPHEIININLKDRPDWFLERNPAGLVPVLEKDDQIVHDSRICNDYLDDVYPNNKLRPDDAYERAKIAMLMELFPKVTSAFFGIMMNLKDEEKCSESLGHFKSALKPYEDALGDLPYFGGDKIGMLDIFVWPFSERLGVLKELLKRPVISAETGFPKYSQWIENMMKTDLVKSTMFSTDVHLKYFQVHMSGTGDYDSIIVD